MSDSLRQHMVKLTLGEVALVLDACLTSGIRSDDGFNFNALVEHLAGLGITPHPRLVRRALASGFFPSFNLIQPKRGRPMGIFSLPNLADLAAQYGVEPGSKSSPIEPADLTSLKTYRLALYRNFLQEPGHSDWSDQRRATVIGLSRRTLRNYDRELIELRAASTLIAE